MVLLHLPRAASILHLLLLTAAAPPTTTALSFFGGQVVISSQKPLATSQHRGEPPAPPQWTLNFSSPAPHAFASVATLLHQWSNTIFPNGHTIAAVEIPAYTLLYHGLISPEEAHPEPPSPEWLAFDLEMSYGIMGSDRNSFLLTYQTTRPVKALYFDGESATLVGMGQMDTQMLHIFGNVSGPPGGGFMGLGEEYLRAHGLCDWLEEAGLRGSGWGFEGIVRMNAGFEIIWCDFLSPSLRLVSRMNVTAPPLPGDDDGDDDDNDVDGDKKPIYNTGEQDMPEKHIVLEGTNELLAKAQVSDVVHQATSYYPLPPQPTKTDRTSEPSHPAPPPNMRWDRDHEPFLKAQGWGWFDSATWHYGSSRNGPGLGEVRAKILGCGISSYYSPQFANQTATRALDEQRSLNLTSQGLWAGPGAQGNRTKAIKQLARRRRHHHLGNVTFDEAMLMRKNSERALRSLLEPQNACSGADWTLITSEIVQRVTNQLTMMDTKLGSFPAETKDEIQVYKWLFDLRAQSHLFMVAYLEYPAQIDENTWSTDSDLYRKTHARCKYRYTRLLVPEEFHSSLSPEEQDMRYAVEEIYGTICSVLITMGFGIELSWLGMLSAVDKSRPKRATEEDDETILLLASQADTWRDNIAELTAWLGWESQYYGCKEMCAWDERCYIPMWPMMGGGMGRGGGGPGKRPGHGGSGPDRGRGPPGGGGRHGGDDSRPPPPGGGDGPGHRPGFKMPPRGTPWIGDDSDLWEPRCVNATFIMGE